MLFLNFIKKNFLCIFPLGISVLFSAFIASCLFAAGINIPASSQVKVNTGELHVGGNITNAGTLQTTTGTIKLIGNWTNSGTFTSGTGTVNFNGTSGTQTVNSGGLA